MTELETMDVVATVGSTEESVEEKNKRTLLCFPFFSRNLAQQTPVNKEEELQDLLEEDDTDKPFSEDIRFAVEVDKNQLAVKLDQSDLPPDFAFINQSIPPEEKMKELEVLFSQMNQDMAKVVTAMGTTNSILNRMARSWGELSFVAKLTIGVVSGVALVGVGSFGFAAHIFIIPTLAGVTGAFAITTTALLDDHYEANQSLLNEIKQGFISLASILQVTIFALEKIRAEFEVELGKLKQENETFKSNNKDLMVQVNRLRRNIDELEMNSNIMQESISKLECERLELEKGNKKQKEITKTLSLLKQRQENINAELKQELIQLKQTNQEIIESKQQAQEAVTMITGAFEALASGQIKNEEQRKQFTSEILTIVNNRDEKMIKALAEFEETKQKLVDVTSELDSVKRSYASLNETYGNLNTQHLQILEQHRNLLEETKQQVPIVPERRFGLVAGA